MINWFLEFSSGRVPAIPDRSERSFPRNQNITIDPLIRANQRKPWGAEQRD